MDNKLLTVFICGGMATELSNTYGYSVGVQGLFDLLESAPTKDLGKKLTKEEYKEWVSNLEKKAWSINNSGIAVFERAHKSVIKNVLRGEDEPTIN